MLLAEREFAMVSDDWSPPHVQVHEEYSTTLVSRLPFSTHDCESSRL